MVGARAQRSVTLGQKKKGKKGLHKENKKGKRTWKTNGARSDQGDTFCIEHIKKIRPGGTWSKQKPPMHIAEQELQKKNVGTEQPDGK